MGVLLPHHAASARRSWRVCRLSSTRAAGVQPSGVDQNTGGSWTAAATKARLDTLADAAPLAALRAVAALERTTQRAGRMAANYVFTDDPTEERAGPALGISPDKARSRLAHYGLR